MSYIPETVVIVNPETVILLVYALVGAAGAAGFGIAWAISRFKK